MLWHCTVMLSHELHDVDRMWKEAFTWSKDALHQLQKPFERLDSVDLKGLNRLISQSCQICVCVLCILLVI